MLPVIENSYRFDIASRINTGPGYTKHIRHFVEFCDGCQRVRKQKAVKHYQPQNDKVTRQRLHIDITNIPPSPTGFWYEKENQRNEFQSHFCYHKNQSSSKRSSCSSLIVNTNACTLKKFLSLMPAISPLVF